MKAYTVITGASSGIGWEAAKAFAGRGKNLILVARRADRLDTLKSEILHTHPEVDVVVKPVDLSAWKELYQFYDSLKGVQLETWVNNAGLGHYGSVACWNARKITRLLRVNVEALTILSSLFVRDYRDIPGSQLINISSAGGYTIVPDAVTYCASKFYVSAFTEGLARELKGTGAPMRAKVLAPAATRTEFGQRANDVETYDYGQAFGTYHTAQQMAQFLLALYDSDKTVGLVDRENFTFHLCEPLFPYAENSQNRGAVPLS